ncbi:MAG: hypothetical protein R6W76_17815 [Caldilinea sp.]
MRGRSIFGTAQRCLCFDMSVQAGSNQGPAQYWGIVFPGAITAVGIFLMRQFFDGVPNEAARRRPYRRYA